MNTFATSIHGAGPISDFGSVIANGLFVEVRGADATRVEPKPAN